jgi:hypothetical protein
VSLLTAILTALIFAAFGFPFRYYQGWSSWGGGRSLLASLAYFALAGGGGGLLGWGLAEISHAKPTANVALNGFLFGTAGALTLRADFTPRRTPQAKTDRTDMRNAASILAFGLQWTGTALDEITRRAMDTWLNGLTDDALLKQAHDIRAQLIQDRRTPASAKTTLNELIVPAMEKVRSTGDERLEGRAHLVTFCGNYLLREHNPKPRMKSDYAVAEPNRKITHV